MINGKACVYWDFRVGVSSGMFLVFDAIINFEISNLSIFFWIVPLFSELKLNLSNISFGICPSDGVVFRIVIRPAIF